MSQAERIVELLGGEKALGAPRTEMDFVRMVRGGLPYGSFERARALLDVSVKELSAALGLKVRTIARRRVRARLDPMESERMLRLARVIARAEEVLGDRDAAHGWVRTPNQALGGSSPMAVLDTDIGAGAVLKVLGRVEHGVVS